MFYLYLLQSKKDGSFYIGQTQNIKERFDRHNEGYVSSTKQRRPWILIGYEKYNTREKVRWHEYELKHSYSKKKKFIAKFLSL